PPPLLPERSEIDVVLQGHRALESRPDLRWEGISFEPGDVLDEADAALALDCARDAEHDAVEQVLGHGRAVEQRADERWDRVERGLGRRLRQVDVAPAADVAREVADRCPHEAGPEVDAQDERGTWIRLEEDGAVLRAVAVGLGLADESRVEQRPERERDRRFRDAHPPRDLRTRDRRVAADGVEHGALVEALQEWGCRATRSH